MKSSKTILELEQIILPFTVTFPETIEGCVNDKFFVFEKGKKVELSFPQFENLMHSSYAQYLA